MWHHQSSAISKISRLSSWRQVCSVSAAVLCMAAQPAVRSSDAPDECDELLHWMTSDSGLVVGIWGPWNGSVCFTCEGTPLSSTHHISYLSFAEISNFQFITITAQLCLSTPVDITTGFLLARKSWERSKTASITWMCYQWSTVIATHVRNFFFFSPRKRPCSCGCRAAMLLFSLPAWSRLCLVCSYE